MLFLKPRYFRKGIMFLVKILIVLLLTSVFVYPFFTFYREKMLFQYVKLGYVLFFILYTFILGVFSNLYDVFRIGIFRLREIQFSNAIACFMTNLIYYFIMSLLSSQLLDPRPMLFVLIIQIFLGLFFYFSANKLYFYVYPTRECVLILANRHWDTKIGEKFKRLRERYLIKSICKEEDGYDSIIKEINQCSTVILGSVSLELREKLMGYCFSHFKRLFIMPSMMDIMLNNAHPTQIGDSIVYLCKNRSFSLEQLGIKRFFDLVVAVITLFVTLPITIPVALIIKIHDKGPIFFKQVRYTRNKNKFTIFKFRSMVMDAEKDGAQYTVENDERITPIGKFIRKTRIDELPQMLNVLKGEMSIVGPRAERVENSDYYSSEMPEFDYRLKVKAGITGYAQIYGKYNTSFEDKMKMDLLYIENCSLRLDLKLILETVKVVFMHHSTEGFEETHFGDGGDQKNEGENNEAKK